MDDNEIDPYIVAQKTEGKHHGWYENHKNLQQSQLKRARQRLQKRVVEHQEKITHPSLYIAEWDTLSDRVKSGIIESWRKEIQNYAEQAAILDGIIRSRE